MRFARHCSGRMRRSWKDRGAAGNPLRASAIHFAPLSRYDPSPEFASWSVNRSHEA
jgi:hypothetical protein